MLDVEVGGETQRYFLPISARWGEENLPPGAPKLSYTLAKIRRGAKVGALIDGAFDERPGRGRCSTRMREGGTLETQVAARSSSRPPTLFEVDGAADRPAPARRRAEQRLDRLRRQGHPQALPPAARRRAARRRGRALPDRRAGFASHAGAISARSNTGRAMASRRRWPRPSPSCANQGDAWTGADRGA